MGKASGGDRQNLGGIVGRFHVITAKHSQRAPIAVPKRAGQPGAGRRTKRFPGNGSPGKDEARDEPQGCTARRAPRARQSRSHEGSRPFCRMGIVSRGLMAGSATCNPLARTKPRIHHRRGSVSGPWDWREHRHLPINRCRAPA